MKKDKQKYNFNGLNKQIKYQNKVLFVKKSDVIPFYDIEIYSKENIEEIIMDTNLIHGISVLSAKYNNEETNEIYAAKSVAEELLNKEYQIKIVPFKGTTLQGDKFNDMCLKVLKGREVLTLTAGTIEEALKELKVLVKDCEVLSEK